MEDEIRLGINTSFRKCFKEMIVFEYHFHAGGIEKGKDGLRPSLRIARMR